MKKTLTIIAFLVAVSVGSYLAFDARSVEGQGLVPDSYKIYPVTSVTATGTSTVIVANTSGIIHNITISSSSPVTILPTLVVYDATSTEATSTTNTKIKFGGNNQTHGTYNFDSEFYNGLKIDVPTGFNGYFVVTYKSN